MALSAGPLNILFAGRFSPRSFNGDARALLDEVIPGPHDDHMRAFLQPSTAPKHESDDTDAA